MLRSLLRWPLLGGLGKGGSGAGAAASPLVLPRPGRGHGGLGPVEKLQPCPSEQRNGRLVGSWGCHEGSLSPAMGEELFGGPQDQPHMCSFLSQDNHKTFHLPCCTYMARSGIGTSKVIGFSSILLLHLVPQVSFFLFFFSNQTAERW